ncbi:MAG: hypothetical protein LBR39_02935 [Coriobacteriales bacterium]|jgi:hypothetical protein|nr:hypothetical protein [Coriobacteriales bacterium]
MDLDTLIREITPTPTPGVSKRWGTVSSIPDDGHLGVIVDGSPPDNITLVGKCCYAEVGDRVYIIRDGTEWTAIARVGGDSGEQSQIPDPLEVNSIIASDISTETLEATGAVSAASLTASGAVTGATATLTGALTAGATNVSTLTANGAITAGGVVKGSSLLGSSAYIDSGTPSANSPVVLNSLGITSNGRRVWPVLSFFTAFAQQYTFAVSAAWTQYDIPGATLAVPNIKTGDRVLLFGHSDFLRGPATGEIDFKLQEGSTVLAAHTKTNTSGGQYEDSGNVFYWFTATADGTRTFKLTIGGGNIGNYRIDAGFISAIIFGTS